jgi:Ca-activated chloride channel homolog
VLLTDGENNTGRDLAGFTAYYRHLPPGSPPVFTIIFGEADKTAMNKLATIIGGLTFDATDLPPSALTAIFEQLRSYQ